MRKSIYCGPQGIDLTGLFSTRTGPSVHDFFDGRKVYYTHKCRTALRKACELLELGPDDEVLVPAYNCGSEVDVFFKAGMSLQAYRVKKTSEIDWEDFVNRITGRTRAALVTHYFGFPQAISRVVKICKEKSIWLIEDCAHALFSREEKRSLGSVGDIAVFSFAKTLGVPDGGALTINNANISGGDWIMSPPSNIETSKQLLPLLKSAILKTSSAWPILGRFFLSVTSGRKLDSLESQCEESGNRPGIPRNYYYDDSYTNRGMSNLTKYLLRKVITDRVVERRRNNYLMLLDLLSESKDITPLYSNLPEGVCPLYFPVFAKDRERVVNNLNKRYVRAISWWRGYHNAIPWQEFSDACMLKDSILALPIHHNISESQIKYMAEQVLEITRRA